MRPPDAVLLDLDGVLYVEDAPVPGAREAVAALRERGMALRFVTNTTMLPRRRILERLHRLGFAAAPHELATPAALAVRWCIDRGHRRVALLMNDAVKEGSASPRPRSSRRCSPRSTCRRSGRRWSATT